MMEPVNSKSRVRKMNLVEDDANLSAFRRRNKILILVLLFLIISLMVVIGVSIAYFLPNFRSHGPHINPAVMAYCAVAVDHDSCLRTLTARFTPRSTVHPDEIFIHSLQAAADKLESFVSYLSKMGSVIGFINSCSNSSIEALEQIGGALAAVRADPALSGDRRAKVADRIMAAEESLRACVEGDDSVAEVREKAVEVAERLNGGVAFVREYGVVLRVFGSHYSYGVVEGERMNRETLFGIGMVGLQVLYMFFMFCCLFRIR